MKRLLKWAGILLLTLIVLLGALAAHTWYAKPLSIGWFYNRLFLQVALDNPELLTQLRMLEPLGIRGHNAKLGDRSLAHDDLTQAKFRADLEMLKSYDTDGRVSNAEGQDGLSYRILLHFLQNIVNGERWRFHNYPVNQLFGAQSEIPNLLAQIQQVNDATDAEHYIGRIGEIPRAMDQVIDNVKLREARNILPPAFVVEKVIDQVTAFIATGREGNPISVGFAEKLKKIPAEKMDGATRNILQDRVDEGVVKQVFPVYRKLLAYLETLRAKATRNDGVWALPDGDKYYEYAIQTHTTTTLTAEQIHQTGLAEVARIGAEMDAILNAAGYTQPTRAERIQALSKSPAQLYANDDTGRTQMLKDYQKIIDDITAGLDPMFAIKPRAPVEVKRVPTFTEKTAPGAYYNPPPLDGSRPGVFFANLRDMAEQPKFSMRTLAYHEAVPGHHLQLSIARELKGLPMFRTVIPFTAYSEGWALYAERLAWEMGFERDPMDNLGRLRDEMFRAVRLVVDTGMHAKRWTREQAIEYMVANTGMAEAAVVTEIERYLVMPGQALAYKTGMLKFLELRERAKSTLGAKFDIREFHDEVLKNGAMPLAVLERVVDAYIARKK